MVMQLYSFFILQQSLVTGSPSPAAGGDFKKHVLNKDDRFPISQTIANKPSNYCFHENNITAVNQSWNFYFL